jgi:hypothetical protein
MDAEQLRQMIEEDELGLLTVKPKQSPAISADERLAESFYEIQEFYKEHGREPEPDISKMQEFMLAKRLAGLRKDHEKIYALTDLDECGLLKPSSAPESIEDVLKEDALNLLGNKPEDSIFNLRNLPAAKDLPDYVASRKPCKHFDQFEHLFKQCHADLDAGRRQLRPFINEQQIQAGEYFILRGVMVYVAEVGDKEKKNAKVNARLHCVFENGTEGDLLLRSLARNLYKDGRRITESSERLMDELKDISSEDEKTGFIYVLRSLSTNPEIAAINDLYKIGFSSGAVEDRIRNAEKEPTYLMAKVHLVEVFECYNLNPQKLESLLHTFFGKACLNVDVHDKNGKRCTPREWFIAPLEIIEEVINLILTGAIVNYRYDQDSKSIQEK